MSADNWAECPRCPVKFEEDIAKKRRDLHDMYGAIPAEEWLAKMSELNDEEDEGVYEQGETFREDYEIYGAENGIVVVSYHGQCEICGLRLSFQTEHPIPGL